MWVVDEGSNMVMKFNPQGRVTMVLGRKDEAKMFLQVPAIKTQTPYFMRKEVEALQEELSGR